MIATLNLRGEGRWRLLGLCRRVKDSGWETPPGAWGDLPVEQDLACVCQTPEPTSIPCASFLPSAMTSAQSGWCHRPLGAYDAGKKIWWQEGKGPKTEPQRRRITVSNNQGEERGSGSVFSVCGWHHGLSFSFPFTWDRGISVDTLMTIIMDSYARCTHQMCSSFFTQTDTYINLITNLTVSWVWVNWPG